MGIFDIFKKGDGEGKNPLIGQLKTAGFEVDGIEIENNDGELQILGSVENGEVLNDITKFLRRTQGVKRVENKIQIADVSDQNIRYKVDVKVKFLNVRKGPSPDFSIKGKYKNGTEVTVIKMINKEWFKVKTDELIGYCHTDFLKKV